jgi:hypothetical protein
VGSPGRPAPGGVAAARSPLDLTWAWLVPLLLAIVALASPMRAVDLAYHVRLGDEIVASGSLPRSDTLTFTADGTPIVDQQWGAQVFLALLHRAGGWPTVAAGRAALIALGFSLVYLATRQGGVRPRTAALLTLGAFVTAAPSLAMRPQLVAVPLFAAALWAVESRHHRPARLWLLPLLAAVAANVHGSFVLLPLLVLLAAVEDRLARRRIAPRLLVVIATTVAATLLNPFGVDAWRYVVELGRDPLIRTTVTEWAPASLADAAGALVLVSILSVTVFLARRATPTSWGALLRLGTFAVLALATARAATWWAMVAAVTVGSMLGRDATGGRHASPSHPSDAGRGSSIPAYGLLGVLVVALMLSLPWWKGSDPAAHLRDAPVGSSDALRTWAAPGSRTFVHQPWASWVEYAAPEFPVFVDSRIEIFTRGVWEDHDEVAFARVGWRDVLQRWDVQAVVATADWRLLPEMTTDDGWVLVHGDRDGVVFVREDRLLGTADGDEP